MKTTWMTPDPVVVQPTTLVSTCRELVADGRFRHLPVVDDGWLVGVLHAADLQAAEPGALVQELDAQVVPLVDVASPLADVLRALASTNNDVVVVTEGGRPIGVYTEHDAVVHAAAASTLPPSVERYMTRPLSTLPTTATVAEARARLANDVQRHLLVTLHDEVFGVLSWRDLTDAAPGASVAECVRPIQFRLEHTATCRDAAKLMARHRIGLLPVTKDGRVCGVISRSDILAAVRATLD